MSAKRSALGRGLDALLPPARTDASSRTNANERREPSTDGPAVSPPESASTQPFAADGEDGLVRLAVDAIEPNPDQPRRHFAEDGLASLADSIARHGVLQPVVVRRRPGSDPARYELVVGERRWRASRRAGLTHIPATVQDVASPALLEVALVENVQRRDLNPMELALAFRALADGGLTQEAIGERVGLDRSSVANHLRLLDLDPQLQQDVESGTLGLGHAKALLQLEAPERRKALRDRILASSLSVRAAEELARTLSGTRQPVRKAPKSRADAVDPNLQGLIDQLRDHLQTRVRITGSAARGKLEVEFYGPEELHRISTAILG